MCAPRATSASSSPTPVRCPHGILPLANSCYVCSVTATTDTYTYGKGEVTDILELSVICYDDGQTTLAFQVN